MSVLKEKDKKYGLLFVRATENGNCGIPHICHFFKRSKFLENKIYTEKTRKLRQNTQ